MTIDEWASDCFGGFHSVRHENGNGRRAWGLELGAWGMGHGAQVDDELRMTNDEWASDCFGGFHSVRHENGNGRRAWGLELGLITNDE